MINQPFHYDKCDKVLLAASMLTCATTANDEGDTILSAPDYGVIDDLAELAAQLLPGFANEGANWDGVMWLERLEAADEDSLARHLLRLQQDGEPVQYLADEAERIIAEWLTLRGIAVHPQSLQAPLVTRLVAITEEARNAGYAITWWSPEEVEGVHNVRHMMDVVVSRGNEFIEDNREDDEEGE
jgi:hypothetical protein